MITHCIRSIISKALPFIEKTAGAILVCLFLFAASANAMIGTIHIDQFMWYHYAIVGAFALGLMVPSMRSTTLSILIALIALYVIVEMLVAFDFVSAEWPRAED